MEKKESVPVKGIVKALFEFQQSVPAIKKESKAGQGNFTYKYGSLPHIIEVIKPHLKKAGLCYSQPISYREGAQFIYTTLYDTKSGEKIESKMLLPDVEFKGMNVVQSGGAVITYVRRYALMSLLGLVSEDDDNDAQGSTKSKRESKSTEKSSTSDEAPAKPWLNPKVGGKVNPTWQEAVKYLADGGTIEKIKGKYRVGKANEEKLLAEALTFDDLPFDRQATEDPDSKSNTDFENQGPAGAEFNDDDNPINY